MPWRVRSSSLPLPANLDGSEVIVVEDEDPPEPVSVTSSHDEPPLDLESLVDPVELKEQQKDESVEDAFFDDELSAPTPTEAACQNFGFVVDCMFAKHSRQSDVVMPWKIFGPVSEPLHTPDLPASLATFKPFGMTSADGADEVQIAVQSWCSKIETWLCLF